MVIAQAVIIIAAIGVDAEASTSESLILGFHIDEVSGGVRLVADTHFARRCRNSWRAKA